jgi:hypothetical protein
MTDNLRSAEAKDIYTLKGDGEEIWEPRFTYHGFRYIEMTGFPGTPTTQTLVGRVVHDDLPLTGTLTTSNDMLNRIYNNATWSIRGNYRGIPTDCPQRDERLGWLGDRATTSTGESFIYDNQALYAKWLDDIESAQKSDGGIPDIVPTYWKYATPSVTWPSTYVLVANMLYEQFGDDEPIRKHYSSMKKWVTYLEKYSSNYIQQADEYGDWALPPESMGLTKSEDPTRITDGTLMNTAYYYYILKLMERFAVMTGNESDRAAFSSRAALVRTAFNQKFLNLSTNQYSNNTVTANLVALACGLVPDELRQAVFGQITAVIEGKFNGQISTGVVGTQWLMRTLTAYGRADLAMRLATNTAYPSWGYMVQNGATTIWELWNGNKAPATMNSGNHVMLLGDLPIWMYENLAGIKSGESGFKSLVMRPVPSGNLTKVSSTFASAYGNTASEWTLINQQFRWKITVPGNTTALVSVPADNLASVQEGNQPAENATGVTFLRMEDGRAIFQIGSGSYEFLSTPGEVENRPPIAPGFSPPAGIVNKSYSYTVPAFTDPEGGTVTHAVSGTIAGLNFNTNTRVLSGTPTTAGVFPLVVQATDTEGASTTATLSVLINNDLNSYDGYLDKVRCDSITGWAWHRDKPNYALTIEFLEGATVETATVVGSTVAGFYRKDLKDAGKGNGAHGYRFKVPESLKDNLTHTIWGRAEGVYTLKWSPKTLTCEGSGTPPPVNVPPVAPTIASLSATTGQTFTTTLPVFSDADDVQLTYSLAGTVPGLGFNTTTRILSGTPTTTGTFSLTYTANDGTVSVPVVFTISIANPPTVNTPPVAPSIASMTITSGQTFTTTLAPFTDADDDPLVYSLLGSVPGLGFNTTTRVLSGTPTTTGTYSLTYAANDGTVTTRTTYTISVVSPTVVNQPPVAPSIASMTVTSGQSFTVALTTFTDADSDPLVYTLSGSVPGLSFTANTRVLSGTPTTTGTFSLTYSANDGKVTVPTTFTISVVSPTVVNQPPVAPSPISLSATIGQAFTTTLVPFTDPESGTLTYSLTGTVPGLSFNPATRILNGTPTTTGLFSLTYAATDSQNLTGNVAVTLTVSNTTTAPALSLAGYDGYLSTVNCSVFSGWVWHRDKPNQPLTVEFLDGSAIETAKLLGTILADDFRQDLKTANKGNGNHGYAFTVPQSLSDGQAHKIWARVEGSAYVLRLSPKDLTCEGTTPLPPTNNAPVAPVIASLTATVGQVFTTTLATFTDSDSDPLTYSLTNTVSGLNFNTTTRVLSGTPTQAGSFTLTYTANDGKVAASTPVLMTIASPPPVNQPPVSPAPVSVSATVGQLFTNALPQFTDPESGSLTYSLSGTVPGISFNTTTRILSGTPTAAGTYSLTYAATDAQNLSANVAVTMTVSNTVAAGLSLAGYDGYLSTVNCDVLSGWVWHRDKPNLPLTVEFLDGAVLATATPFGTVLADDFRQDLKTAGKGDGNHGYSFPVPQSLKDDQTHTIWARVEGTTYTLRLAPKTLSCETTTTPPPASNQVPVAPTIAKLSATVGQSFSTILPVFTDPDNDPMSYALTGSVPGLSFNSSSRVLSGTPTQAGSFTLTYAANDGEATVSTLVVMTVNSAAPANKAPVAPSIASMTAIVGQAFTATLSPFTDPENGALTYAVTGLPAWLTFNTGSRVLSGTPTAAGTQTLTYSATDNKNAKTSLTFTLIVNAAPLVTGNFEGYLDIVNCINFAGWIWNRDQPNTSVTIEFLEGAAYATAKSVGTMSANIYREDLKNAGKGNGMHGYSFAVPQSLKNSQQHTIWARVLGGSFILTWSPKTINCAPNQRIGAIDNESLLGLSVTPNPTAGLVTARFQLAENQKASLNVTDLLGRTLHQREVLGTGQPQEETIDLSQNTAGMHFIYLKTDQQTLSSRILLHH